MLRLFHGRWPAEFAQELTNLGVQRPAHESDTISRVSKAVGRIRGTLEKFLGYYTSKETRAQEASIDQELQRLQDEGERLKIEGETLKVLGEECL
jgi:hypothetical protein